MSYKGDNVESLASDTYDGSDLSQNMAFTVKSQNKTLTQGTDYTVTFEKQADDGTRTKVETITDAGTYIITVEGLTYTGKAEFTFVVSKAELKPVLQNAVDEISWASGKPVVTDTFLPYTGSAVDISFSFELDGKAVELPADSWGMTVRDSDGSKVSSVVNKGTYSVAFDDSGVQNYDILDTQVKVAEAKSFADVEPSDWFAGSVYQAKENGYVKGVSGTAMYMPDADILRRDVVVILARMARMDDRLNEMNEDQFNSEYGYTLDFSDVSSNAYYARALAWATKSGIVHGDAGADTFRPDDTITREEFAGHAVQLRQGDGRGYLRRHRRRALLRQRRRHGLRLGARRGRVGEGQRRHGQQRPEPQRSGQHHPRPDRGHGGELPAPPACQVA